MGYSIEDPAERREAGVQLPTGNPLDLKLNEVALTASPVEKLDGTFLPDGADVVIRAITPTPTVDVATIEPMGVAGTTGEYLTVKLPMLIRKTMQ